jgi:hypothetical protein
MIKKTAPKKKTAFKKRSAIRFTPDLGTIAQLELLNLKKVQNFGTEITALVLEESYRGCGLALPLSEALQVGDKVKVRIGAGAPLLAEVRWRTELDSQIMRIGLMYLE